MSNNPSDPLSAKRDRPSERREICRDVYQHEVLYSFNSDEEAEDFRTWLLLEGFALWEKWEAPDAD